MQTTDALFVTTREKLLNMFSRIVSVLLPFGSIHRNVIQKYLKKDVTLTQIDILQSLLNPASPQMKSIPLI